MKLKIILFAFLISALAACSVEQDIFDTLTTENSLKNQGNITTFVNGAYARFSGFNGFKTSYMTYFYSADDLNTRPGAAYASRYSSKTQDAFSTEVSNFWSTLYQTINSTNFLIENIDPVKADSLYKRRVKGEMYFLRGFSYFYLVRMWGGVPLKTKPTSLDDDLKLPRSSVDQVYAQIFADFEEANKRLLRRTSLPSAEFGHATKGAAQAFLSKAYLDLWQLFGFERKRLGVS
jgi:starch-binding outer membrane protein, SusD/RagB family